MRLLVLLLLTSCGGFMLKSDAKKLDRECLLVGGGTESYKSYWFGADQARCKSGTIITTDDLKR